MNGAVYRYDTFAEAESAVLGRSRPFMVTRKHAHSSDCIAACRSRRLVIDLIGDIATINGPALSSNQLRANAGFAVGVFSQLAPSLNKDAFADAIVEKYLHTTYLHWPALDYPDRVLYFFRIELNNYVKLRLVLIGDNLREVVVRDPGIGAVLSITALDELSRRMERSAFWAHTLPRALAEWAFVPALHFASLELGTAEYGLLMSNVRSGFSAD